jgi:hypothetical protein
VRRVIKERGFDVTEALELLEASVPSEHQKRFREVLAVDDYSPAELSQLWLEGEYFMPEQWIILWDEENPII